MCTAHFSSDWKLDNYVTFLSSEEGFFVVFALSFGLFCVLKQEGEEEEEERQKMRINRALLTFFSA